MAKTCKFYKLKQEVSFDCGETWESTGQYDKGSLYEVNSRDCGFMLIYRWALSQGDYDCDGVKKYNVEVLQFTTEQGGEYQNVSPEYKRRTGGVVERLSEDCGYVESTGGFKFSGTSVINCSNNSSVLTRREVSGITAPHSIVGDCTEVIGEGAFSGSSLQTIDISSYTTEIRNSAFAACSGITSMTIPNTVEKIDWGLFGGCINLTGATLPSGLDYIPTETFKGTAVEEYTVPNGIRVISNDVFNPKQMGQDLEITFTTGVTDIGESTFAYRNFSNTLSLPSSLKYIANELFRGATINSELVIPNGVEHIGRDILIDTIDPNIGSGLTIPGSVKLIAGSSWEAATSIKRVTFGEGTEAIINLPVGKRRKTLSNIPGTTNFLLGVIDVDQPYGDNAYFGEFRFPANVQIINNGYFELSSSYYSMVVLIFESPIPPLIYHGNFIDGSGSYIDSSPGGGSRAIIGIFAPDESIDLYRAMWGSYVKPVSSLVYKWEQIDITEQYACVGTDKHYVDIMSVSVDSGATWYPTQCTRTGALYETNSTDCGYIPSEYTSVVTYNDGKVDSVTPCAESTTVPSYIGDSTVSTITIGRCATSMASAAFSGCTNASGLTIESGITSISNQAFTRCTSLTSVTIPNSVTSIGDYAFGYCFGLTSIVIPDSVTSIGDSAFNGCTSLTSVTIGDSVTSISQGSFRACTSLTSVTIPNSVTSIGEQAFWGCSSLTSIVIPDNVTSIGISAFTNCSGIVSVTIGSGVTSISQGSFRACTSLTSIVIPDSVTSIGDYAFYGCSSLSSIDIPYSVTSIGEQAFLQCTSLTNVTIGSGVTSISGWAFYNCSGLTSITIEATTPPTLGNYALSGTNNCPIYVPSDSVSGYKSKRDWRDFASRIQAIPT